MLDKNIERQVQQIYDDVDLLNDILRASPPTAWRGELRVTQNAKFDLRLGTRLSVALDASMDLNLGSFYDAAYLKGCRDYHAFLSPILWRLNNAIVTCASRGLKIEFKPSDTLNKKTLGDCTITSIPWYFNGPRTFEINVSCAIHRRERAVRMWLLGYPITFEGKEYRRTAEDQPIPPEIEALTSQDAWSYDPHFQFSNYAEFTKPAERQAYPTPPTDRE